MIEAPAAVLLLADGTLLKGTAIGAIGTTAGEICFNTGMTGYQEVFTDPSYAGQIIVTTHVHIGNYGVHPEEAESRRIQIAGLICRSFSEVYSRPDASDSLQDYFVQQGVVGIAGIDTRALVRHIRSKGAMNCIISSQILEPGLLQQRLSEVPDMAGLELSSAISTKAAYHYGPSSGPHVAVYDYGVKQNILDSLTNRGLRLTVVPAKTPVQEVIAMNPAGVLLSNGPGDPAAMPYATEQARGLMEAEVPMFGICLGHQILAQAAGATTFKMPYGHRGLNHPVLNLRTGRAEITSQNHGFSVDKASAEASGRIEITHLNLNDNTVEGLEVKDANAFSVQYHPESNPGPHDSGYLFDAFVQRLCETV